MWSGDCPDWVGQQVVLSGDFHCSLSRHYLSRHYLSHRAKSSGDWERLGEPSHRHQDGLAGCWEDCHRQRETSAELSRQFPVARPGDSLAGQSLRGLGDWLAGRIRREPDGYCRPAKWKVWCSAECLGLAECPGLADRDFLAKLKVGSREWGDLRELAASRESSAESKGWAESTEVGRPEDECFPFRGWVATCHSCLRRHLRGRWGGIVEDLAGLLQRQDWADSSLRGWGETFRQDWAVTSRQDWVVTYHQGATFRPDSVGTFRPACRHRGSSTDVRR